MFCLNFGSVANDKKEANVDVELSSFVPVKSLIIGGGLLLSGVCTLVYSAFKTGGERSMKAEYDALQEIGSIVTDQDTDFISKFTIRK